MTQKTRIAPWAVLFWLAVWQLAAMAVGKEILLVSPMRVLSRLGELIVQPMFYAAIAHSLGRIALGFLLAAVAGTLLAAGASKLRWLRALLAPMMLSIKSVPVASFIILALVWVSSKNLAVLIVFLMVLPVIYLNVLGALTRLDPKLFEMARVFRLSPARYAMKVVLPQLAPSFLNACELALGLCWKAGVAAEVIGMPKGSIGEKLQQAKVYLDTPDLFAWTLVIVAVSWAFGQVMLKAIELAARRIARVDCAGR